MIPQENLNIDKKMPVVIFVDKEDDYSIQRKPKAVKKPNYFMIGNGTMNKQKMYAIDLLTELANSTKAEQFILLSIKDGICYGNDYNPVVKVIGETETQKQYIKLGYKSLEARGLVLRIKKSYYMINPNALIPPDYEAALQVWEEAVKKQASSKQIVQRDIQLTQ